MSTQNTELELIQDQLNEVKAQNEQLVKDNKELTDQLSKAGIAKFESRIDELEKAVEAGKAALKEASEAKAAVDTALKTKSTELEKSESDRKDLEDKLTQLEADIIYAKRVNMLVSGGMKEDLAKAKVDKYASLSDDQFADIASVLVTVTKTDESEATTDEAVLDKATPEDQSASAGAIDDTDAQDSARATIINDLASSFASAMNIKLEKAETV